MKSDSENDTKWKLCAKKITIENENFNKKNIMKIVRKHTHFYNE